MEFSIVMVSLPNEREGIVHEINHPAWRFWGSPMTMETNKSDRNGFRITKVQSLQNSMTFSEASEGRRCITRKSWIVLFLFFFRNLSSPLNLLISDDINMIQYEIITIFPNKAAISC